MSDEYDEPDPQCATCSRPLTHDIGTRAEYHHDLDGEIRCANCCVHCTPVGMRIGAWRAIDPEEPWDQIALDRVGTSVRDIILNTENLPSGWKKRIADVLRDTAGEVEW